MKRITLAAMVAAVALAASALLVGCAADGGGVVGGVGDQSATLEQSIESTGATQLQANLAATDPSAVAAINSAQCTETGDSQAYTCLVIYNVTDVASSLNQDYLLNVDGSCDDLGNCQWHATGDGIPTTQ